MHTNGKRLTTVLTTRQARSPRERRQDKRPRMQPPQDAHDIRERIPVGAEGSPSHDQPS